jgi:hypothetical protein
VWKAECGSDTPQDGPSFPTVSREAVPGVAGAFILRNALRPEETAALLSEVRRLNADCHVSVDAPGATAGGVEATGAGSVSATKGAGAQGVGRAMDKTATVAMGPGGVGSGSSAGAAPVRGSAPARRPRRQSRAARLLSARPSSPLFREAALERLVRPLRLVPPTDDIAGRPCDPVEPAIWQVRPKALARLAARLRPHLPVQARPEAPTSEIRNSADGAGPPEEARISNLHRAPHLLAAPGHELSPFLRCYRYREGQSSIPHFDRSYVCSSDAGAAVGSRRRTYSARSAVFYLNDDFDGGQTTFFRPLESSGGTAGARSSRVARRASTSRSGLTWASDGGTSKYEAVARVRPRAGDCLIFPHGDVEGGFPNPLHEGSAVRRRLGAASAADKCIIRTDIMFVEQ